jgi:hypothetical protein
MVSKLIYDPLGFVLLAIRKFKRSVKKILNPGKAK